MIRGEDGKISERILKCPRTCVRKVGDVAAYDTRIDVLIKRRVKLKRGIEMKTKRLQFENLEQREVFSANGLCDLAEPEGAQIDSYRVDEETFDFLLDAYDSVGQGDCIRQHLRHIGCCSHIVSVSGPISPQ